MGAGAGVPLRELGLVLLVALSLAYLTTGVIRYLMVRSNWMTEIRDRDVHTIPKPRMGGVAMFTGFIGAVFRPVARPHPRFSTHHPGNERGCWWCGHHRHAGRYR